jgi:flagellar biosynthetic protein FliO
MIEQILAAVLVIALLLATIWLLRRRGLAAANPIWTRAGRSRKMQVIERLQLTAHHSLHLVKFADELLLIGVSPSSCGPIRTFQTSTLQPESSDLA